MAYTEKDIKSDSDWENQKTQQWKSSKKKKTNSPTDAILQQFGEYLTQRTIPKVRIY